MELSLRRRGAKNNAGEIALIVRYYRTMISARDFPLLPVFVAVASTGSFTRAAHQLGLGKSVVSQHVKTLEERCAAQLIERSTRRLRLTPVGEQVLDAAHQVLASFRSLEQLLESQKERPTGTLRVTCPLDVGLSSLVSTVASALLARHPELKLELVFDDAVHDLLDEKLDVALRLNTLAQASYVVRRLGSVPEVIVASPVVLDALDGAEHPAGLAGAPWLAHAGLRPRSTWTFRSDDGERAQVRVDLRALANTSLALRDLLLAGAGLAVLPLHMVGDDLKAGRLRRACPAWTHRRLSLHAVLPTRGPPPRVRAFLTAIAAEVESAGFERLRAP
jgi:DNA-binding transcriptional LysR family regulator